MIVNTTGRHQSTEQVAEFLEPNPNLWGPQLQIATDCALLASKILGVVDDDPELTMGLRKLLEAKDCFVRASLRRRRDAVDA